MCARRWAAELPTPSRLWLQQATTAAVECESGQRLCSERVLCGVVGLRCYPEGLRQELLERTLHCVRDMAGCGQEPGDVFIPSKSRKPRVHAGMLFVRLPSSGSRLITSDRRWQRRWLVHDEPGVRGVSSEERPPEREKQSMELMTLTSLQRADNTSAAGVDQESESAIFLKKEERADMSWVVMIEFSSTNKLLQETIQFSAALDIREVVSDQPVHDPEKESECRSAAQQKNWSTSNNNVICSMVFVEQLSRVLTSKRCSSQQTARTKSIASAPSSPSSTCRFFQHGPGSMALVDSKDTANIPGMATIVFFFKDMNGMTVFCSFDFS